MSNLETPKKIPHLNGVSHHVASWKIYMSLLQARAKLCEMLRNMGHQCRKMQANQKMKNTAMLDSESNSICVNSIKDHI